MNDSTVLTNRERRENVAFLYQAWLAADSPRHTTTIDAPTTCPCCGQLRPATESEAARSLFFELCYLALSQQPAPASVVDADWRRLLDAGVPDAIWEEEFSIERFAVDPPVARPNSKGKVIDMVRLSATRQVWRRLIPEPADPDVAVDVIHAASGGALKSKAFAAIRAMLLAGEWTDENLERFAVEPSPTLRKRAIRIGLIDLPEKADTFADLKAVSRATRAVLRLGEVPALVFDEPITLSQVIKCEVCDAARMARCPVPHCRRRREHTV